MRSCIPFRETTSEKQKGSRDEHCKEEALLEQRNGLPPARKRGTSEAKGAARASTNTLKIRRTIATSMGATAIQGGNASRRERGDAQTVAAWRAPR
jgi:hypothetical protein